MPKKKEDFAKNLADSFSRWDKVYKVGSSDPFWPDGVNLNLIRNHIIYYKKQIEDEYASAFYPELYYRETPVEVPTDYMARADEIRENAPNTLKVYKADPAYNYLLQKVDLLPPEVVKRQSLKNVIGYVLGLENAIAEDDLVGMRRHENPESYLESFARCAKRVKDLEPPTGQLSIFDAIAAAQDKAFEAEKQKMEQCPPDREAR